MDEHIKKILRDAKYKTKYEMIEKDYKNIKEAQKKSSKLLIIPYNEEKQPLGCMFWTEKITKDILDVIEEDINSERYKASIEMDLFQVDK